MLPTLILSGWFLLAAIWTMAGHPWWGFLSGLVWSCLVAAIPIIAKRIR